MHRISSRSRDVVSYVLGSTYGLVFPFLHVTQREAFLEGPFRYMRLLFFRTECSSSNGDQSVHPVRPVEGQKLLASAIFYHDVTIYLSGTLCILLDVR